MRHSTLGNQAGRITHLIGDENYTRIYFTDAPDLLISRTLSYCTAQLPHFLRLHRMCAANPDYINEIRLIPQKRGEASIAGSWLPVSNRRLPNAIRRLKAIKSRSY
ncbi:LytTR family transcriptional regulator DNA-binding domain-containing protein [Spirosoma flavum]|uniref:LytTR family transcriptional regulator DNA-binding domain-containing protein n=1 Tax=Spirosoma flavum TaxID=2048557 RepID=A0ABW6APK2_9BACT